MHACARVEVIAQPRPLRGGAADCMANAGDLYSQGLIKTNCFSSEQTADWHLLGAAAPLRANTIPAGPDQQETEGPVLFPLRFLAAGPRFLRVYQHNRPSRPAVGRRQKLD